MQIAIDNLLDNSRSLWVPLHVKEYSCAPSALSFLRDHVGQSVPCVWRGAVSEWHAVQRWNDSGFRYLRDKVGDKKIQVAITPNGRADAVLKVRDEHKVKKKVFAMPWQQTQSFSELLDALVDVRSQHGSMGGSAEVEKDCGGCVPYYSAQDGSLMREVSELMEDVDEESVRFAEEAFGERASAVNIWVGDGRSLTTMHADPFENLYAVVSGVKIFELRPPSDAAMLRKPVLQTVQWVPGKSEVDTMGVEPVIERERWSLERKEGETAWVDDEVVDARLGKCLTVELRAGDLLYLPGLWFHRVRQHGVTIAINWWFEMTFGRDWVYKELCQDLGKLVHDSEDENNR